MEMNKKGAMPVPYIIALVLGITVVAVIIYWLLFTSSDTGSIIIESACQGKQLSYCNAWRLNGYSDTKPNGVDDFSASCGSITEDNKAKYYAPECCQFWWASGVTEEKCES